MKIRHAWITLLAAALLVTAGCGTKQADTKPQASAGAQAAASAPAQETQKPKTKVLVGTSGLIYPVTFYDKDNKLTGVDVELTKEIFKRLPEYEFEFYIADLTTLFIALDTNKIQMVAHSVGKNPERLKKYLYAEKPHNRGVPVIAVKQGRKDIQTVDDLQGKTVPVVGDGALTELYLQKYNEEHKQNPVKIQYGVDVQAGILGVANGKYDASISSASSVENFEKTYGIKVDQVLIPRGHELNNSDGSYLIYRPDQQVLKEKVDKVFQEIKNDGTLSKIFLQFYVQDYSKLLDQ